MCAEPIITMAAINAFRVVSEGIGRIVENIGFDLPPGAIKAVYDYCTIMDGQNIESDGDTHAWVTGPTGYLVTTYDVALVDGVYTLTLLDDNNNLIQDINLGHVEPFQAVAQQWVAVVIEIARIGVIVGAAGPNVLEFQG